MERKRRGGRPPGDKPISVYHGPGNEERISEEEFSARPQEHLEPDHQYKFKTIGSNDGKSDAVIYRPAQGGAAAKASIHESSTQGAVTGVKIHESSESKPGSSSKGSSASKQGSRSKGKSKIKNAEFDCNAGFDSDPLSDFNAGFDSDPEFDKWEEPQSKEAK